MQIYIQIAQRRSLRYCTVELSIEMIWGAGGNDYISIATQNTSVTAERVVDLIEDSMQQLFRRGARKCAAILLQTCTCQRKVCAHFKRP